MQGRLENNQTNKMKKKWNESDYNVSIARQQGIIIIIVVDLIIIITMRGILVRDVRCQYW